jgi:hypothetical protein
MTLDERGPPIVLKGIKYMDTIWGHYDSLYPSSDLRATFSRWEKDASAITLKYPLFSKSWQPHVQFFWHLML